MAMMNVEDLNLGIWEYYFVQNININNGEQGFYKNDDVQYF